MQEVVRPVDGIDDPGPAAAARHGGTLFAQDAVFGPAAPELFQHVGLGGVVGGRDHIRDGRLLPALQPRLPHQQRQRAGLADQGLGQLVVIQRRVEFRRAVPAKPVPANSFLQVPSRVPDYRRAAGVNSRPGVGGPEAQLETDDNGAMAKTPAQRVKKHGAKATVPQHHLPPVINPSTNRTPQKAQNNSNLILIAGVAASLFLFWYLHLLTLNQLTQFSGGLPMPDSLVGGFDGSSWNNCAAPWTPMPGAS